MTAQGLAFTWDGEAMRIASRFARQADQQFVIGETYTLAEVQDRSSASHRHFFASVNEAWMNLPESWAERFPSAEHLRKFALIKAGYRDERSIACASKAEAQRVGAFVKPLDDYAVVVVMEAMVVVMTAKSQSVRAMGKTEFQASKDAVLQVVADLIGTDVRALGAARAA